MPPIIGKSYLGRIGLDPTAQVENLTPTTVLTFNETTKEVELSPANSIADNGSKNIGFVTMTNGGSRTITLLEDGIVLKAATESDVIAAYTIQLPSGNTSCKECVVKLRSAVTSLTINPGFRVDGTTPNTIDISSVRALANWSYTFIYNTNSFEWEVVSSYEEPQYLPYDKINKAYSGSDFLGTAVYYFEGSVVTQPEMFKALYFKSTGATVVNVAFFTISGGVGTVLHTEDINAVAGVNAFGFYDFNLPTSVKNAAQFYIGIKPAQNDKINFTYSGGNLQILNPDGSITPTSASMPFWIEVEGFNKFTLNTYQETKTLTEATSAIVNYDYINNPAILPSHLYIRDDKPTKLHKTSMYRDIKSTPNTLLLSEGRYLEIHNPTEIYQSQVGDTARIIVNKNTDVGKFVYKDLEIIKAAMIDKVGKTISVMCIGDSLTEGGDGTPSSSPTLLSKRILDELSITMNTLGTIQRTDVETYQNEGRGGWRFRTFTGLESKFAGVDVIIPSPTQRVWVEGVDGTIVQIKSNNPWLYEATSDDKTDYPERCYHFVSGNTVNNISYAQNPSLGTYLIFDPARYLSERGIDTPDIVTIALGTNEWYLNDFSGFDINLIYENARWMIERIVTAMPTAKVIVIPCNNFPASLEYYWYNNAYIVTSLIIKICDEFRALGNMNLFTLSIFAQCPRTLAYESIGTSTDISPYNTTKQADASIDVHILNSDNQSRADYLEFLVDCLICSTT